MMRIKIVASCMVILMMIVMFPRPTQGAQFIISTWEFGDGYGQGVDGFRFYENSTGSWVAAPYYNDIGVFYYLHYYDPYTLNWSAGVSMKLRVYTIFNSTLAGAIDEADGQNYQRHNVTVRNNNGVMVFSQQNLTYYGVEAIGPMWTYKYDVVLNFLPVAGVIYTVVVSYEIFYLSG